MCRIFGKLSSTNVDNCSTRVEKDSTDEELFYSFVELPSTHVEAFTSCIASYASLVVIKRLKKVGSKGDSP